MDKNKAIELSNKVIENALAYFKQTKNFGAYTALNKKKQVTLIGAMRWIKNYCTNKGINYQEFVVNG